MLGLTNRTHPLLPALLPALAVATVLSVAPQPAHAGVTSFFVDLWGNLADTVSMSGQATSDESETPKSEPAAEPGAPKATETLLPPIDAAPVKKVETEMPSAPKPAMSKPAMPKPAMPKPAMPEPAMPEPVAAKAEPTSAATTPTTPTTPTTHDSGPVVRGMHRVAGLFGGARAEENLHGLPVR